MDAEPWVALVERYAQIVTTGDVAALDAICAADFVNHRPTGTEGDGTRCGRS